MNKNNNLRRSARLAKAKPVIQKKRLSTYYPPIPRKKKKVGFNNPKPLINAKPSARRPNAGNDDFNTPKEAWDMIGKQLNIKEQIVWAPFYNDGNLTCGFKNRIHQQRDFFAGEPDKYDCVIDNPPYSIKKDVIERLMLNGKPFALLIPLETVIRKYFMETVTEDFTLIIPARPYKFKGKEKTISVTTAWFCWGFKLGKQIIWEGV